MTAKIDDRVSVPVIGLIDNAVFLEGKAKCVKLHNCDCDVSLLPKDAQTLQIFKCNNLRSSSPYLECARELKSIFIGRCEEIEDILSYSYTFRLQCLCLYYLGKLQVLFREGQNR